MDDLAVPQRPLELTPAHLTDLDERVEVPTYDRSSLRGGIVHIGVGGFHRAHQAVYLDDLFESGLSEWSITGAGVLPGDVAMAEALGAQDGLYSLVTRDQHSTNVRVIGSIVDYLLAAPSIDPLVEALSSEATRIVSLTITEGGYPVDEETGAFVPGPDGRLPPAFEALVVALGRRRAAGLSGVTIMSCDNIMHNGATAKAATLGAAATVDATLAAWAERNTTFPNTMVDRITPQTTTADRDFLANEYGIVDRWPVVAETFTQWVIEDSFVDGRPPWEDAGAFFTDNVEPYEILKLRLLNAGHSCLAYLAALAGHVHVHEVMADPLFARYLTRLLDDEASPALPAVPGIDVGQYKARLAERFANPQIKDQVARLCLDGSSKFPKFLIPTIEVQLARQGPVDLAALALAGWCQYLLGKDEKGAPMDVARDPNLTTAHRFAESSATNAAAFLDYTDVLGPRVAGDKRFEVAFVRAVESLRTVGVHSTLDRWLNGDV